VFLDRNEGHGRALDHGFLRARTRNVVALDVDAMPISPDWLPVLLSALDQGATVAGIKGAAHLNLILEVQEGWVCPDFVHPSCLAMRLRRFVYRRHTFRKAPIDGRLADPGELIGVREREGLWFLQPTSVRGPGTLGQVHGEIVYHNGYGTRHRKHGTELVDGIPADEPPKAWGEAVARYLG
jgi:glycosyltransferase involved in cell wall biosynthesis